MRHLCSSIASPIPFKMLVPTQWPSLFLGGLLHTLLRNSTYYLHCIQKFGHHCCPTCQHWWQEQIHESHHADLCIFHVDRYLLNVTHSWEEAEVAERSVRWRVGRLHYQYVPCPLFSQTLSLISHRRTESTPWLLNIPSGLLSCQWGDPHPA